MIALPSADLPPHLRLQLLAEHAELELLRIAINSGTPPAVAVRLYTSPDQKGQP